MERLALGLLLVTCACGDPAGSTTGTIAVSVTGEDAAKEGIAGEAGGEGPFFADGWTVKFDRWLVVLDNLRLNQPGTDPGQQRLVGALVAQQRGPFVVDLTRGAQPLPLATFTRQDGGAAFDTRTRYAFSFDVVPAAAGAKRAADNTPWDTAGEQALQEMVQKGYAHYVAGTATRQADSRPAFADYPTEVRFAFGWGGAVSYVNCSNPDNGADEQQNRGVQPRQDGAQRAQITMHLEHPFWARLNVENPDLRFDAIAARAGGMGAARSVTLEDLQASRIAQLTDRADKPVKDRLDPDKNLVYDVNGAPGVSTLREFMVYSAQTMAHLNGDGLCFPERK